jgi:hypothetical protein
MDKDIYIPAPTMGQSMSVAAAMVIGLTENFIKPDDTEDQKVIMSYLCLSIFLYQLCTPAKYKDKMIGILEAIIDQLKEPT